jgi:nucleoid DNA-binding protein
MNKTDLVERVWKTAPRLTRRHMEAMVGLIFEEITAALLRGDRVEPVVLARSRLGSARHTSTATRVAATVSQSAKSIDRTFGPASAFVIGCKSHEADCKRISLLRPVGCERLPLAGLKAPAR